MSTPKKASSSMVVIIIVSILLTSSGCQLMGEMGQDSVSSDNKKTRGYYVGYIPYVSKKGIGTDGLKGFALVGFDPRWGYNMTGAGKKEEQLDLVEWSADGDIVLGQLIEHAISDPPRRVVMLYEEPASKTRCRLMYLLKCKSGLGTKPVIFNWINEGKLPKSHEW